MAIYQGALNGEPSEIWLPSRTTVYYPRGYFVRYRIRRLRRFLPRWFHILFSACYSLLLVVPIDLLVSVLKYGG